MSKITLSLSFLLVISLIINAFSIREIIKYEPEQYKYRVYHKLKQSGYFDQGSDVGKLDQKGTAFILTLGQSNAGNSSNSFDTVKANGYSYYKGLVYPAADPLIGCSGTGGSVWTVLADKIINSGHYQRVVIIPIAVGSTNIESWAHGECSRILTETLADLKKHHVVLTHILWQQGESDNGSSKASYKQNLAKIVRNIRDHGQMAPFFCAISSYSNTAQNKPKGVDTDIEDAQREFISENTGVITGPDTDTIIDAIDRHDSLHFSKTGKIKYANLWYQSLFNIAKGDI